MVSPLDGKIAAAIGKAFASTFYDATLTRVTPGTPDPEEPWIAVEPETEEFACKAIVEQYSAYHIANSLVEADDRKILVLATSLAVTPNPDTDKITIRGATYSIIDPVHIDPANAVWTIQGRR